MISRLRAVLADSGYTVDGVAARLGDAHAALRRNETTPAWRITDSGDSLDTLIRLFLLQRWVSKDLVEIAFGAPVEDFPDLFVADGKEVKAMLDIRPHAEGDRSWWVIADLTPGLDGRREPMRTDYVLGIAPASLSLVNLTVPVRVDSALDVGTGCGIQALHLAEKAGRVVATDVNPRALRLARWTAELNNVELDVREGSLYEPVAGERFSLIVSNPPYVIAPPSEGKLTYRETGFAGDAVVERLLRQAPDHLTEGGWCQLLANWTHVRGEDWPDRLAVWTGDRSAWAVQREVLDPAEYVELWLRDAGLHGRPEYVRRYDEWLTWLGKQGVEAIGMGWITLRNVPGELAAEAWPYEIEQPIGPHVLSRFERGIPDELLEQHLVVAADVIEETTGPPGADDPATIVLRRQRGMRRAEQADTVLAGFVGACDGELGVGQILGALANLLDRPLDDLHRDYLPTITHLIREGFLDPR